MTKHAPRSNLRDLELDRMAANWQIRISADMLLPVTISGRFMSNIMAGMEER